MGLNAQLAVDNQKRAQRAFEAMQIESRMENVEESDLYSVKGLGKSTIEKLFENGIKTIRQLKNKNMDDVREIITHPIALEGLGKFFKSINK